MRRFVADGKNDTGVKRSAYGFGGVSQKRFVTGRLPQDSRPPLRAMPAWSAGSQSAEFRSPPLWCSPTPPDGMSIPRSPACASVPSADSPTPPASCDARAASRDSRHRVRFPDQFATIRRMIREYPVGRARRRSDRTIEKTSVKLERFREPGFLCRLSNWRYQRTPPMRPGWSISSLKYDRPPG
jgi:hypothetical protein